MDNREDIIKTITIYLKLLPKNSSYANKYINFIKLSMSDFNFFNKHRNTWDFISINDLSKIIYTLITINKFEFSLEHINKYIIENL